ncbi:MAG: GspH/FimT family pseudopilin [Pseudomonadota bacterium]
MNKCARYRSVFGFTLVEILVVMVIIALMSALVIPKLAGSLGNINLKTSARKIASTLRMARNLAVSESKPVAVIFDLEARRVSMEYGGNRYGNQAGQAADKDTVTENDTRLNQFRYTLPEEIFFGNAISGEKEHPSGRFKIFFYPTGGASGGKFLLRGPREKFFQIDVNMITGAVALTP